MTQRQSVAADNLAKLPELCYVLLEHNAPGKRIAIISAGESGYYPTKLDDNPSLGVDQLRTVVSHLNRRLGVTPAQAEAMFVGSLFGWDVPGADPDRYSASKENAL